MRRILYIVPYVPDLIRVRPYNLIKHLSRLGHEVTVLTLWSGEHEHHAAEQIQQYCHGVIAEPLPRLKSLSNCLRALPSGVPLQAAYAWNRRLTRHINNIISQVDVVHVEHLRGAHYALHAKAARSAGSPPIVWDSVDSISYLFEQAAQRSESPFGKWASRVELSRTRRYEGWLANQFDHVLVTSQKDKSVLEQLRSMDGDFVRAYRSRNHHKPLEDDGFLAPTISVLPNGVDLEYFHPTDEVREADTLVFSGKMSYHANITSVLHLVNEVMPLVWREKEGVRLVVVGKDPPKKIRNLQANHAARVLVTDTVPDIRPYLRRATLAVVPLVYGAGLQNKVLEAMATGTPVVATDRAISAFNMTPGKDVMVGSDPGAFAHAILRLLDEPQLRQDLSRAGRRYVEEHHTWSGIASQLEEVYDNVSASIN